MERVKNIESLSLMFTAGVVAGTVFFPGAGIWLPALLLPLASLPILAKERLLRMKESASLPLLLGSFLLLGMFCARTAALPWADTPNPLELLADSAVASLRARIHSLPFSSGDTAHLLDALLTGDRSGLSARITELFRQSGASHILALSGLHMGILYGLLVVATRPMGHSPLAGYVRAGLLVGSAGFFTLMAGAGPSLVRAFLFISLNELLRALGRPRKASRVFCTALLIQLVWDPSVVGSTGFQLSYLAMAGIFLLYPVLERWYPEGASWNPLRRIWKLAALSISCQAFTAPLAWLRFHSFPQYFLVTNLLALPLTTALMTTALAAIVLGWQPLITATDGLSRLLLWVLEVISSM